MIENHQLVPNATKLGLKRINQHRNSKGAHWKEAAGTGVAESRGDDFFIPEGINGSRGGTPCKKNQGVPPQFSACRYEGAACHGAAAIPNSNSNNIKTEPT